MKLCDHCLKPREDILTYTEFVSIRLENVHSIDQKIPEPLVPPDEYDLCGDCIGCLRVMVKEFVRPPLSSVECST